MSIPVPQQLLDFSGKTVIVTGAGSGIGAGIALRFAEAGANLVVHYRTSAAGATQVLESIKRMQRKAVTVQADLAQSDGARTLVAVAVESFGAIDVLINNAGSYPLEHLLEISASDWDAVINDNLRSVHLCTRAVAEHMVATGQRGVIVNIASIEAENPAPQHAHYDAAKAGVVSYTRSAAQELGRHGIRVNCVSPGLIWRDGLDRIWPEGVEAYHQAAPLARLGEPSDVADACLFLASPAARWITGVNLVVDGGVMTHRIY